MKQLDLREKMDKWMPQAIGLWEKLVDMGGCCKDQDTMKALALEIEQAFEGIGFVCELVDVGGGHPPIIYGNLHASENKKPVLFCGHYDTIFPYAQYKHPAFSIKDGRAYGPGVLDMKGGIVISWLIAKCLTEEKYDFPPIRIVYVGDEELDRENADTVAIMKELTNDCAYAFNMETGNMDNTVCISRKGVCQYTVTVTGVSSHPGNFFERGRNAIEEAAQKIIRMQQLTAPDYAYTVNVGTISGGLVSNRIPERCVFQIDTRFSSENDRAYLETELKKICEMQFIDGTTTQICVTDMLPPFETHDKERKLYEFLQKVAQECGLAVPGKKIMGGASDAAYISQTSTPILCAMGVCGENNHSPKEFAVVSSIMDRATLLLQAVLHYEEFFAMEQ